jgi:hypothetical protein
MSHIQHPHKLLLALQVVLGFLGILSLVLYQLFLSFSAGLVNPSGTLPPVAPNVQFPVVGQSSTFPFPGQTVVTTQPPVGTQFPGGSIPLMGGPNSPLGQNIPPALAQYWTQLLQNLAQNPGGKQVVPTQGQPYPGVTNPIWGSVQSTQP